MVKNILIQQRTESADVYLSYVDPQRDDTALMYPAYIAPSWLAIAYIKTQQDKQIGIKFLVNRYPENHQPSVVEVMADTLEKGCFSIRPYQLGQHCDGSIDSCVMALFCNYCASRKVEPQALHRQAYQENDGELYCEPDFPWHCGFGDWQGVDYPETWDESAVKGLTESLRAINNHLLATLIEEQEV